MAWLIEAGGSSVELKGETMSLGRLDQNDIVFRDDLEVSRHHAQLVRKRDGWWIRDLQSANGTFVDGHRIFDETLIRPNAKIRIGKHLLLYTPYADQMRTVAKKDADTLEAFGLTERESDVLALLAHGLHNKQIARRLGIKEPTVAGHLANIRDKTGQRGRADLTRLAIQLGMHPPPAGDSVAD